jgi:light-regulated signal transduction histidine kinase (bacteriophytochrome)
LTRELLNARDDLLHKVDDRTRELQHSYDQLLKKNMQLQQFTYAASHDLQTPLRGIGVYAGALKEDYGQLLDEQATSYIDFVVKEAQRLQRLINDLLEYARLDHSGVGAFTGVDLNSIIDEIEAMLQPAFGELGFSLAREHLPPLHGNSSLIAQLFYNLIENGIKYRGAEQPQITISHSICDDAMVEIAVQDNGMGIESIHHERIFEIFRRLHTQEEFPGTGIGLALCKRIVENHGGSIHLSSEPGAGSTFYIRMPVHMEQEVEGDSHV